MLFSSETEKRNQMNRNCQHCVVNFDGYLMKGEQYWQNGDVDCGVAACCHQGFDGSLFPLLSLDQWEWSWTKRVKRENYLKIVLKLSQYVSKCFLIVVSKLSKLIAHCSHWRLLINGRGLGQKNGPGLGQKGWKGKRRGWETGNALHEQWLHRQSVLINRAVKYWSHCHKKIIVKRGNHYFCPATDSWSAWQIMRPKSHSSSVLVW